jgi:hypothetical protein
MSFLEAAAKAGIKVNAKLCKKYNIKDLGPAHQFLAIEIHHDGTRVGLRQKGYIITILRGFSMEHTHDVSTPMDPTVKLDSAEEWG